MTCRLPRDRVFYVYVPPDCYRGLWDLKGSLKCRPLQYFLEMNTSRKYAYRKIRVFKCGLTKRRGSPKCQTKRTFYGTYKILHTVYLDRYFGCLFIIKNFHRSPL